MCIRDSYYNVGIDSKIELKEEDFDKKVERLKKEMLDAASNLEFEEAARIRDELKRLSNKNLLIDENH